MPMATSSGSTSITPRASSTCRKSRRSRSRRRARRSKYFVARPQESLTVPLTTDFRKTVRARAARDPAFRKALFQEAVQTLLEGDLDAGRSAIRDYINATLGFERLSATLGRPQKSLMRMFGPGSNPTAENLLGVIGVLQ